MRLEIKKLLEKLGVNHVLSPYETQPWFHYDGSTGVTCSAEVRMGPGGDDLEAEIQFLQDEDAGTDTGGGTSGPSQIMLMKALASGSEKLWTVRELLVKGESYENKVAEWEDKGCNFFRACIQALQMGDLPNIDELIKQELGDDDDWGGGKRGKIGRKSPKIKPGQLLGMKRGF